MVNDQSIVQKLCKTTLKPQISFESLKLSDSLEQWSDCLHHSMGNHLLLVYRGRKHSFPTISGGGAYVLLGKLFLRLMVCSVQEKVHNQFEELSLFEENWVRQPQPDDRLKAGGSMNFGRGCHILPVFPDRPPGKEESVADSVANPFLALLPSPPVSSADSFIALTCLLQRPWLILLCLSPRTVPARQTGDPSMCLRWLLPFFVEAAKTAELVGHLSFFVLTAKAFSSSFTCWLLPLKAPTQPLTLQQMGRGKKAFQMNSPVEQSLRDFIIILWISVVFLIHEAPKDF